MVELNFFLYSKLLNFKKLLIIENRSIIILLVKSHWKFLGGIQNIEWSNVERPGFRNLKNKSIKITKDELFFYLRIFSIFLNDILIEI